ncbi:MAG: cation:dicarboxylate symporter family transporter, partial [Caulobacterales bacterium]
MKNTFTLVILAAMVVGGIVGAVINQQIVDPGQLKEIIGYFRIGTDLFLRLIKMIIAPLVFSTLVVGIAHIGDTSTLGRVGAKTMAWFVAASLVSLTLGLVMVNLLQPGVGLDLHVIDVGIGAAGRARLLESWRDKRLTVHWHSVDRLALKNLPVSDHITPATYARLFAPRLLPTELRRVIYLDSDLLVLEDLAALWAEPMADAACLAVPDLGCPWVDCAATLPNYSRCRQYLAVHPAIPNYRDMGISPTAPYFNA